LTGVEAVSNGVKAFRENAQRTLTVIISLLAVLLAGISYLVKSYGIAATDPGQPGYQSLLSMLIAAVFGKGNPERLFRANRMALARSSTQRSRQIVLRLVSPDPGKMEMEKSAACAAGFSLVR